MIKVEIVADSINQQKDRIISMVLTYPRIIHAEMLTHRMFSRNASSSRAVPVKKMIEAVRNNTFCPMEFQKAHTGMQGSEYFTGKDKEECRQLWLETAEFALNQAEKMLQKGISKQIINRILEPYQYYTVLITGSKEGWENFFKLRNSVYVFGSNTEAPKIWYSKKDAIKDFPEWENRNDLFWQMLNKGQAEIHMMCLSEKIYDAIQESKPTVLQEGEWHIPFEDRMDSRKIYEDVLNQNIDYSISVKFYKEFIEAKVKISTAMAARTSYTVVGDEKEVDYAKMIELHDKLIEMRHSSPFEHCARTMSDNEYEEFIKGRFEVTHSESDYDDLGEFPDSAKGWCYNLKGFIPYRYMIDNKIKI